MAQTAVSWLLNEIFGENGLVLYAKQIEQAKAMEKEQLKKAYYTDAVSRPLGVFTSLTPVLKTFENYYNETYTNGL